MKENEISVTFHADKDVMEEFYNVRKLKAKTLGVDLNKKQAIQLALKEMTEIWKKENPE